MKSQRQPTFKELEIFIQNRTLWLAQREAAYARTHNPKEAKAIETMKSKIKEARSQLVKLSFDSFYRNMGQKRDDTD